MSLDGEIQLIRDTSATMIPSGDEHTLPAGTRVIISQALGGSVTIRTDQGLYRIDGKDLDALGDTTRAALNEQSSKEAKTPSDEPFSEDHVWEAMKGCFDPEIPVNVVDLGLIYDLQISEPASDDGRHSVQVKMTLTAQGCGMGPVIAEDVKNNIESLNKIAEAKVDIVWDPPWTPHMISEEGRKKLGIE
ncbi:putative Fe-S cluster assembly protein SufT [Coraliomargarita sinensis]|uniref:Putative Fe-S cluster assembly protein SufT n=1 Tax=Coraliomargarita sinensis TaxID=2174842 RepID=A0A317ZGZ7_9BACT|nr:putative Fe-S cluster assembly protein SufT [Coraliomargarita sinensis]PXA04192.1 putative Fe-S cluster assembly protein SufT [Coraliomargarita sinensis]